MKKDEKANQLKQILSRSLTPDIRQRLERLLLKRIKRHKGELKKILQMMSDHWTYEDHFYRYYHGSYKVYRTQTTTEQAVKLLRQLLPERELNLTFEQIIREGTGKEFKLAHNKNRDKHTRPMLDAFAHAKFMIEMAARYANLTKLPQPMPSGYAALLYLYDLR
jgi:hypothetical protein